MLQHISHFCDSVCSWCIFLPYSYYRYISVYIEADCFISSAKFVAIKERETSKKLIEFERIENGGLWKCGGDDDEVQPESCY